MALAASMFGPIRDLSDLDVDRGAGTWAPIVPGLSDRWVRSIGSLVPLEMTSSLRAEAVRAYVWSVLDQLAELPPNWDSYGGRPLQEVVARFAERFLVQLLLQGVVIPVIVPTPDGGLVMEWHRGGLDLVVRVPAGPAPWRTMTAFFSDESSGEEWEGRISVSVPRVQAALGRLALAST